MKRAHGEMEQDLEDRCSAGPKEQEKVDMPSKKQRRVGPLSGLATSFEGSTDAEEEDEGSNFLTRLPYLPLRRVLDYLTPSSSSSEHEDEAVPEQCRVRFRRRRFEETMSRKDRYDRGRQREERTKFRQRMDSQLMYYTPAFLERQDLDGCLGSVAALRLTSRATREVIESAIGGEAMKRVNLFAPMDRFLRAHLMPEGCTLPSSSECSEEADAQRKEEFRMVADLTLGTLGARLQQSRLSELADYMWTSWKSLSECHRESFTALIARQDEGQRPLLQMESFRHEEDYVGEQYGAGAHSLLSIAMPGKTGETAYVQLGFYQCWDERDSGWDLHVYLELYSASADWIDVLELSKVKTAKKEEDTVFVVLCDFGLSRGYVYGEPLVQTDVLEKLAERLGMVDRDNPGKDTDMNLLTVLLACLGFAWKADVARLEWDDEPETTRRRVQDFPHVLRQANSLKRADRRKMGPYLRQLNAFLDKLGLTSLPENKELLKQAMKHSSALIAQLRLSHALSTFKPTLALDEEKALQAAKALKVSYARSLSLGADEEYSGLRDETVVLSFPLPAHRLHEMFPDEDAPDGTLHLQFIVLNKSGNHYTGGCAVKLIAVRVIGAHRLRRKLFAKLRRLASRAPSTEAHDEDDEEEEVVAPPSPAPPADAGHPLHHPRMSEPKYEIPMTVTLTVCMRRSAGSSRATALVGRLLGLALKQEEGGGKKPDDMKMEQEGGGEDAFGSAVIEFLSETARCALRDADEGAFPLTQAQLDQVLQEMASFSYPKDGHGYDEDEEEEGEEEEELQDTTLA